MEIHNYTQEGGEPARGQGGGQGEGEEYWGPAQQHHITYRGKKTDQQHQNRYTRAHMGNQPNNIISHIEVKDICKYTNFQIQNRTKHTNFQYKRKDQLNNIISHIEVNTNMHNNTQICKIARKNNI